MMDFARRCARVRAVVDDKGQAAQGTFTLEVCASRRSRCHLPSQSNDGGGC